MVQDYKWYADPLYGKTQPVVVANITVVHTKLYTYLCGENSKVPMHIYSFKVSILLCKHDEFLLTDYDHDIFVYNILRRYIVEYDKQLSEYYEKYSD